MENFEYSKVFPSEGGDADKLEPSKAETIADFLYSYERELRDSPRFLLPHALTIFEKAVASCERIAKKFSGMLKFKNKPLERQYTCIPTFFLQVHIDDDILNEKRFLPDSRPYV